MLEARNLVKVYKPKKGVPVVALNSISLKFAKTGMVFILGKSGSGKSTLLNVLGGLDSFDSGEIYIKGKSAASFKQKDFDSYRNTYIGFIFQEYNIIDDFTVGANIALAIQLQGRKATDEEINKILKEVDLEGYGNRKPNELSGGQKQRVAIARALVKNPEIIMADEPTGALDSNTGKQVFETLQKLSRDKLVLIVSHDREFAERYGDRVIELADGNVIADDEKTSERVEQELEENLVYDNQQIHIKKGYHLTKEDLDAINKYLDKINSDVSINNGSYVAKEHKKIGTNFRPTRVDEIEMSEDGYQLIKSKLPLSTSFKIGASGLNHKKFRLVFTILLSFVAFTLFGLADTVSSYDFVNTAATSLVDSNIDYASFQKYKKVVYGTGSDEFYWRQDGNLSETDIENLKNETGLYVKGLYLVDKYQFRYENHIDQSDRDKYDNISNIFPTSFNGIVTMTNDELEKDFGYTIEGRLPNADNEIAITKYIAEEFTKIGYLSYDEENKKYSDKGTVFTNYSDIIGKYFYMNDTMYKVVGIVDTGFDYSRYEQINDQISDDDVAALILRYALMEELRYAQDYSLTCSAFVNEGLIKKISINAGDYLANTYNFGAFAYYMDVEEFNGYYHSNYQNVSAITTVSQFPEKIYFFDENKTTLNSNELVLSTATLGEYYINKVRDRDTWEIINEKTINASKFNEFYYSEEIGGETVYNYDPELMDGDITLSNLFSNSGDFNNLVLLFYGKDAIEYAKNNLNEFSYTDYLNRQDWINTIAYRFYSNEEYSNKANCDKLEAKFYEIIINNFDDLKNIKLYVSNTLQKENPSNIDSTSFKVVGIVPSIDDRMDFAILSDSFYNEFTDNYEVGLYNCAVSAMPKDKATIKNLLKYCYDETKDIRYGLNNSVCYELDMIKDILAELKEIFIWVGLFFAVFAALMLSNFISTSVSYKKKDIGILRAIGSRSWDVFQIFFSEAGIIAAINFILAVTGTAVITEIINAALREDAGLLVTILTFGIRQIGLILAICLFVAFISTILPVFKYAKKRPIETIRKANE